MAIRFGKCGVEGGVKIFSLSNWLDVSVISKIRNIRIRVVGLC